MTKSVIYHIDYRNDNTILAFGQENSVLITFRYQKYITFVFNNNEKVKNYLFPVSSIIRFIVQGILSKLTKGEETMSFVFSLIPRINL